MADTCIRDISMDKEKDAGTDGSEFGIFLPKESNEGLKRHVKYDRRMEIIRETILSMLRVELTDRSNKARFRCADISDGSGVAGLQWKKMYKEKIHVTVNTSDSVEQIQKICECSELKTKAYELDVQRTPGDDSIPQEDDEVHVCRCAPNVLLHVEAFDFIYLVPHGNMNNYFDAIFTNICNKGIFCVASSDISPQFIRTSHVIRRHYHANVIKTDYIREMAVRVILAAMVRSASNCNKGLDILCSLCVDDFFLIVVRVLRGPKHADKSVEGLRPLLHCQMCEEHAFLPYCNTPIESPYQFLQCNCHVKTPGKTAVILGPMWYGNIFNSCFMSTLIADQCEQKLSEKLKVVLTTISEESLCRTEDASKHSLVENSESNCDEPPEKKKKLDVECTFSDLVPQFFYNLHRRKFKEVEIPKSGKLITLLRSEGYRASRTHFDPLGIRTSASLKQLYDILLKYCKKKT